LNFWRFSPRENESRAEAVAPATVLYVLAEDASLVIRDNASRPKVAS
jgi:hypothetical protein